MITGKKERKCKYIQIPFSDLPVQFPKVAEYLKKSLPMYYMFLSDPSYLVRLTNYGKIEIGYGSDTWDVH